MTDEDKEKVEAKMPDGLFHHFSKALADYFIANQPIYKKQAHSGGKNYTKPKKRNKKK